MLISVSAIVGINRSTWAPSAQKGFDVTERFGGQFANKYNRSVFVLQNLICKRKK